MNNSDLLERMKPCDICERPIGHEAMIKQGAARYHARCLHEEKREIDASKLNSQQPTTA